MPNISSLVIIAIVVVAVVLVVRSYVMRGGKSDCCGDSGAPVKLKGPRERDTSHYPHAYSVVVTGMSCENCTRRIANAFNAEPGMYAEVSLADERALVHTKQPAAIEHLRAIVRSAGYGAGLVHEV